MDFLSSLAKGNLPKPTSDEPKKPDHQEEPSKADLFASAKVVGGAAQGYFSNESEKYDKAKVAGASADLLDAAAEYGKLDETKGVGKYVNQAEDYLRQYNTSPSAAPAPVDHSGDNKTTTAPAPIDDSGDKKTTTETTEAEKPSGGAGDYIKMAEGFLNKPSGDGEKSEPTSQSEGGYGDLMKMAGGFLKK